MSNTVTPLRQFQRRVPEAGRLRYGVKTANAMKALEQWRFTSRDRDSLDRLAEIYGGQVSVWNPGRGRSEFELLSTASVIDVIVPPNALGETPIYEMWSGGGLQRRCDGQVLQIPTQTPEGAIVVEQACICEAKGRMQCKPITRLNVLMPDIPFTGVWMMEAKGWNAAHELPGMVDMVVAIQDQGFARAQLALEKRTKTEGGKTSHFMVPVLRTPATLNQLAEGEARLMSIATGPPPAAIEAPTGQVNGDTVDPDDEIAEAEIVDEGETPLLIRTIYGHVNVLNLTADVVQGLAFAVSEGTVEDVRQLDYAQLQRVVSALEKVREGTHVLEVEGRRTKLVRTA